LENLCPSLSSIRGAFHKILSTEIVREEEEGSDHVILMESNPKMKARDKKKRKRGDLPEGELALPAAGSEIGKE